MIISNHFPSALTVMKVTDGIIKELWAPSAVEIEKVQGWENLNNIHNKITTKNKPKIKAVYCIIYVHSYVFI